MEVQKYISTMCEFQALFINLIEDGDFQTLINFVNSNNLFTNYNLIEDIFHLILHIADDHHRENNFFNKIIKFLELYLTDIKQNFTNLDIFNIFKSNRLLLLYLLRNNIITLDESCMNNLINHNHFYKLQLHHFLYSEISTKVDNKTKEKFETEILSIFNGDLLDFTELCQKGENDAYVCSLIRDDLIEEFVSYINKTNFPIKDGKIQSSIFETNPFLVHKNPTLIEYAAFFGSIQIFQYLKMNNVELKPSLWLYSIHGRNAEIIHILEENKITPEYKHYGIILNESIICHHNHIANYIIENLINQESLSHHIVFNSYNYAFVPSFLDIFSSDCSNEYEFNTFKYLQSIETIILPQSATKINDETFKGFKSLKHITIPSSVTLIGNSAFNGCTSLAELTIPSSVTLIGNSAFNGCTSLVELTIPSSVTLIGSCAFNGCSSLKEITIPSSIKSIGNNLFTGCNSLEFISILSNKSDFFNGCSELNQITNPSSLTSIGCFSFKGCSSLKNISIPSTIKEIGSNAFENCSLIDEITIPSSVSVLNNYLFYGCSSLKQIEIPPSVTEIKNYAFAYCSLLSEIQIPSSVTKIRHYAFYGCSSLKKITIPSSVKLIGKYAFGKCSSLEQISINSSSISIGNYAFYGCVSVNLSDEMIEIPNYLFYGCSTLTNIKIPSSIESIGKYAFANCSSLKEIFIPSSVTKIKDHAFDDCSELTQITLPSFLDTDNLFIDSSINLIMI